MSYFCVFPVGQKDLIKIKEAQRKTQMNKDVLMLNPIAEYHILEDLVSLTEGTKYTIQTSRAALVCEKDSDPLDGEGYYVSPNEKFKYTPSGQKLYIKVLDSFACRVNIGD